MSLSFYDSTGRPYAYSDDDETIFTFSGKPIAYIDGDSIFTFSGKHIGYFVGGLLRDPAGSTLLFTDGALGGPTKPIKAAKPIKGIKGIKPIRGIKQIKPIRPVNGMGWSSFAPQSLFES